MNSPMLRTRRVSVAEAMDRVETAATRPPQRPQEPPPRAADNPFDAASADLAARWDRMKHDCEQALAAAKATEAENLHLRERVRSLETMLDQQSTTYDRLLEHHTLRGDEAVQDLADLKTRFTLIRDTLSAVLADPALVGARPEKLAPQPPQAVRGGGAAVEHAASIGQVVGYDETAEARSIIDLPPEDGIRSLIHRLAPVSLVR